MIEFNDIDFRPQGPREPMMHPHHHHHDCEPMPCPPPPFDPELKRIFDLAAHADRVAHKALDVAGYANLDASAAKKLAEKTLSVLTKVSNLANKANLKADNALSRIDFLSGQLTDAIDKLDRAVEVGAGLASDGSYNQNQGAAYIEHASSLADADNKLDAAIKHVSDEVDSLEIRVNSVATKMNSVGNIIGAVGLDDDGNYVQADECTIINNASSVLDATKKLEKAIKDRVTKSEFASVQSAVENIPSKEDVTQNANDIDKIERKLGDLNRLGNTETIIGDIKDLENNISGLNGGVSSLLATVGNCPIPSVDGEVASSLTCEFDNLLTKVRCNERDIASLTTKFGTITVRKTATNSNSTNYQLFIDGVPRGETIVVEKDSVVSDGYYDAVTKEIVLELNTGTKIRIPANDINVYEAGKGLELVDRKKFNIKLASHAQAQTGGLLSFDGNQELDAHIYEGNGLESYPYNVDGEVGYGLRVKIAPNSQRILNFNGDGGLQINIGELLAGNIIGDEYINVTTTPDGKVKLSLNVDAMIELIKQQLLWKINENDDSKIMPKNRKSVNVEGTIEATGAIYSGQ